MDDVAAVPAEGADRVGLLDIGMEGIVHGLDGRMADFIDMGAEGVHGVDEIAFEPVERFKPDRHPAPGGVVADGALAGHRALLLDGGRPRAGEPPKGGMQRSGKRRGAQRSRALHRPFHIVDPSAAGRQIGGDQVHRRIAHRRNGRPFEADAVEQIAKPAVVVRRAGKHRDLDPVISGRLEVCEQPRMLPGHCRRPQEHAETDFHNKALPFGRTSCAAVIGKLQGSFANAHTAHRAGLARWAVRAPQPCATMTWRTAV